MVCVQEALEIMLCLDYLACVWFVCGRSRRFGLSCGSDSEENCDDDRSGEDGESNGEDGDEDDDKCNNYNQISKKKAIPVMKRL